MSASCVVVTTESDEESLAVLARASAAGAEVAAGTKVAAGSAGMSLIMSSPHPTRLGLDKQRSVRQGPTALETLKQLVKFIGEYRPMLGSPVWLLRKCQNELGLFMRALVRSYMLPIEDLPKFLIWHVWPMVRLMVEESCRRVVSRCFQNQRQSAAFVSLFKSLQSIELAQTGNPHERMFLHCGTLELTTMVVRMCQGENGIDIRSSYDAAFCQQTPL